MFKSFTAVSILIAGSAGYDTVPANRICMLNDGTADLTWRVRDWWTYNYSEYTPITVRKETYCMDLEGSIEGLAEGDRLEIFIQAEKAIAQDVDTQVIYQQSPAITVNYTCEGSR